MKIEIELDPPRCPSCDFQTRVNGRLQHDSKCPLRGGLDASAGKPGVTDAMRQAAWKIYPGADVPYTEIYWAMQLAKAPAKD